ncbi:hypothetical protein FACS1894189_5540 [Planctomycetales bacterium]|nr:hypothetical protein FACS1894189_5540 [Planctomycetales bacterium]
MVNQKRSVDLSGRIKPALETAEETDKRIRDKVQKEFTVEREKRDIEHKERMKKFNAEKEKLKKQIAEGKTERKKLEEKLEQIKAGTFEPVKNVPDKVEPKKNAQQQSINREWDKSESVKKVLKQNDILIQSYQKQEDKLYEREKALLEEIKRLNPKAINGNGAVNYGNLYRMVNNGKLEECSTFMNN